MQGEVTGPGQCSNQVDTYGKECLQESKLLYNYKDDLGIPPLGMVDDVLAISSCGADSVQMNAFLNAKTSIKRLQYGPDKCHQLHVGKDKTLCPDLFIDEWKLVKKDELQTGIENLVDKQDGIHKLESVQDDKYLGDIISVDGRNSKNIGAKKAKAVGIVKQIKSMLEDMCLGSYYFEVALILRNSLFINGILTNLEASYGLSESEIVHLEQIDESLLCMMLECPYSAPREMLYLEMGATPIRYIIMSSRLMFYHYILRQPADSLILKFYKTQYANPIKNDWCLTVQSNLETLKINNSESEMRNMSQYIFKKLVNTAIRKETFQYLIKIKNSHSKLLHIQYDQFEMQEYFLPNKMPTQLAKFAFLCRTRMIPVGANFKAGNLFPRCPLCKVEYDSQKHLLFCPKLSDNIICQEVLQYGDLFHKNVQKKIIVIKKLHQNLQRRQTHQRKSKLIKHSSKHNQKKFTK